MDHIIAVYPLIEDDVVLRQHPALARLRREVVAEAEVRTEDGFDTQGRQWRVPEPTGLEEGDRLDALPLEPTPQIRFRKPIRYDRPVPDGTALVPRHSVSYSQISDYLAAPLRWVLERRLGLRAGSWGQVPTGSQAAGTLVHAAVEELIPSHADASQTVSEAEAREVLTRLLPEFDLELCLPEHHAEREAVLHEGAKAIAEVFRILSERRVSERVSERAFHLPLLDGAPHRGQDDSARAEEALEALTLDGRVDVSGLSPEGAPVVLDLKWSRGLKRYREMLLDGDQVQLAAYAHALGDVTRTEAGYVLMRHARLVSESPLLTGRPKQRVTDLKALWDSVVRELRRVTTGIVERNEVPQGLAGERMLRTGSLEDDTRDAWIKTRNEMYSIFTTPAPGKETAPPGDGDPGAPTAPDPESRSWRYPSDDRYPLTDYALLEGLKGDWS